MAEYESRKVKDMDMQVARDEVRDIRGDTDYLEFVFTRKPKCIEPKSIRRKLMDAIKEEGYVRGDCGKCGTENTLLCKDRCVSCTAAEVNLALFKGKVGPLKEKYGI